MNRMWGYPDFILVLVNELIGWWPKLTESLWWEAGELLVVQKGTDVGMIMIAGF